MGIQEHQITLAAPDHAKDRMLDRKEAKPGITPGNRIQKGKVKRSFLFLFRFSFPFFAGDLQGLRFADGVRSGTR